MCDTKTTAIHPLPAMLKIPRRRSRLSKLRLQIARRVYEDITDAIAKRNSEQTGCVLADRYPKSIIWFKCHACLPRSNKKWTGWLIVFAFIWNILLSVSMWKYNNARYIYAMSLSLSIVIKLSTRPYPYW